MHGLFIAEQFDHILIRTGMLPTQAHSHVYTEGRGYVFILS
jgi:hypothetical protein